MSTPSPQPQTVTQTSKSEPWDVQKGYLEKGFRAAETNYNDPSRPQFYPGQTFANASAETEMAGQAATGEALRTINGDYIDPSKNSGLRGLIDSTMARVMPGVNSPYIAANRTGSGLHGRAIGEGVASGVAPLYQAERERMIQAPQQLAAVGAQRETWAQKPIDEAVSRFDFDQNAATNKLANYMQMVQGNYGGSNTTTGQTLVPQQNTGMQVLGILGNILGMGLGGLARSDIRSKKDIKRIGATDDGLGVYSFRYKTDDLTLPKRIGVMAQEVALKKPHAVAFMPDGYLGVNHGAL